MTRKQKLSGATYRTKTGCGNLYVTINEDGGAPVEIFATMGKTGGCADSQIETIGRLISLGLRNKVAIKDFIKQMGGVCCHSAITTEGHEVLSCSDAIAKVLKKYLDEKEVIKT
jgi:ribonucleoside-diphosphate reductase alpha chain